MQVISPDLARNAAALRETVTIRAADLPLDGVDQPQAVAVIARTDGPAYRPPGAFMVIGAGGCHAGNLSSGCIDADILLWAEEVVRTGQAQRLRYGLGSPFRDLVLPCGGGLDIRVLPIGAVGDLDGLRQSLRERRPVDLFLSGDELTLQDRQGADLHIRVLPDLRFVTFGKGPEVMAFASMAAGAGYETLIFAPEDELSALSEHPRLKLRPLPARGGLEAGLFDSHTAATLFFHDHDLEPGILAAVLRSDAFYVGAQGSRRAAANRLESLRAMGLPEAALARMRGPIGLIPSTRDARTLAVSVLAEVLAGAVPQ
ncbi:MAG: XdhC family protein [Microbacterium sp.]